MTHYTAVVIIERVEEEQFEERDQYGKISKSAKPRITAEVAKFVLRSSNIVKLKEKIPAHVELIDQG